MLITSRISINAIGKIKKSWIADGINQYRKRMPKLSIYEFKDFKFKLYESKIFANNNAVENLENSDG